jgi:hypothetical protein
MESLLDVFLREPNRFQADLEKAGSTLVTSRRLSDVVAAGYSQRHKVGDAFTSEEVRLLLEAISRYASAG